MSHRIQSLNIKNYRSIKELDIELQNFTPVVGQNNVGKSNILNAIHGLLSRLNLKPGILMPQSKQLKWTGVVTGVSEEILNAMPSIHKTKIEPYVSDGEITIKRSMASPGVVGTAALELLNPQSGVMDVNPAGIPNALKELFPEPLRVAAMSDASEDAAKIKRQLL